MFHILVGQNGFCLFRKEFLPLSPLFWFSFQPKISVYFPAFSLFTYQFSGSIMYFHSVKFTLFFSIFLILRRQEHMEEWVSFGLPTEGKAKRKLIAVFSQLKKSYRENRARLLSDVHSKKTRGNGCKPHHRKFQLDIKIIFVTTRVWPSTETWNHRTWKICVLGDFQNLIRLQS